MVPAVRLSDLLIDKLTIIFAKHDCMHHYVLLKSFYENSVHDNKLIADKINDDLTT